MFNNIRCTIPQDIQRQTDKRNKHIINVVLYEDKLVKNLRSQELKLTAENPRIRQQNETTEISAELRDYKRDQFLDKKRRQQLLETSHDLRQLQIQIRAAHASKQLIDQLSMLHKKREEDKQEKRKENEEFEAERKRTMAKLEQMNIEERKKKDAFRGVLQGQMAEGRERRLQQYEEVLNEREEMKKLLARLEEERAAEQRELEKRKQISKEEMRQFIQMQELIKSQAHAQKIDENERFLEVMRQRDEDRLRLELEKRRTREKRQELSEHIGQKLFEIKSEKSRREDLLLDLLVEERKANEDLRYRHNLEKQMQERIHVRQELESYRQDVLRHKEQHLREEEELRKQQMQVMAERDKLAQLSDEKRRQKRYEHRQAILEMIEVKRRQRSIEAAKKLEEFEMLSNDQRKKEKQIEDERIRLLKNTPSDVLRYLSVGVLRDTDQEFLALPAT